MSRSHTLSSGVFRSRDRATTRLLCGVLLLGLATFTAAADTVGRDAPDDCGGIWLVDVLDSSSSAEIRLAAIAEVQRLSLMPACASERYLLGLLHRHGPALPGNPLPKDAAKARALLESYGLEGNIAAFSELAEFELAEGNARAAMQWTQVYLYLVRQGELDDFDRRGYNGDLMLRATKAMKKAGLRPSRNVMGALLNDYLQPRLLQLTTRFAEQRASDAREHAAVAPGGGGVIQVKRGPPAEGVISDMEMDPGYAVYLLEVQPDGVVSRIVAESFGPTVQSAVMLRPLVEGFEFHPFHGDSPQVVRVPVVYGYDSHWAPTLKTR